MLVERNQLMTPPTHAHPPSATGSPNDPRRAEAHEYVEQLRAFQIHAAVFAAGMVVIFLVNLFTNVAAGITGEWWAWWSGWALIGWGLGIAVHGLVVRLARPRGPGPTWEQQQIDKILSEDTAPIR